MAESWVPKRVNLWQQADTEEKKKRSWLDWINEPFAQSGAYLSGAKYILGDEEQKQRLAQQLGQQIQGKSGFGAMVEAYKGILGEFQPGGEYREQVYEKLPWYEQMAWEAPTMVATAGIPGAAAGRAALLARGTRAAKVGAAALKPVAAVEQLPSKIADPILQKVGRILSFQKSARAVTKELRTKELGQRVAQAEEIFQKTLSDTGDINQARIAQRTAMKGQMPTSTPYGIETIQPEEMSQLRMKIAQHPTLGFFESDRADRALMKFLNEPDYLMQPNEIKTLERIFPGIKELNTQKGILGRTKWTQFMDVANLPRSILASGDLSFTLRQGGILIARRPQELLPILKWQLKTMFSQKNWQALDDIIRNDPDFGLFDMHGGYLAPEPGALVKLSGREEQFMSNIAERLPGALRPLSKFIQASERSFTAGANYLRFKSFKSGLDLGRKLGLTSENDIKELAHFVNIASGRGELPKGLISSSPLLNALMFSPRLVISKLQLPKFLFSSSLLVRREAWRTFVQFMGFGTGILSIAKLAGAEMEYDPRSSDFGKIKIGNTRLDVWTGYLQWARLFAQLSTAERKITTTGEITEVNRKEILERFAQSKGSPFMSLMLDLLAGQNYIGEDMFVGGSDTAKREVIARLVPLFAQDMYDAIKTGGITEGAVSATGGLGVGVVSYEEKPSGGYIPSALRGKKKIIKTQTSNYVPPWKK